MTDTNGAPPRLGDLDLEAHLRDPARKQQFVTPMFDIIAPRYDAFTRLFSFGMDRVWKQRAIDLAVRRAPRATMLLDLASGTGDVAVMLARALPDSRVAAVDASPRMIEIARERLQRADRDVSDRVHTDVGDMLGLTQETASMDLVTASYGVRNVPDSRQAIREMARVLKPGGLLVTLDFYRPSFAPWRALFLWYLSITGNVVGWWWHRDPVVYGYIARSIAHFMSANEFHALLESEGLRVRETKRYLGGGVATHVAERVQ